MPCFRIQYSKSSTTVYEADVLRCVSACVFHSTGASNNNGAWLECADLGWDANTAPVSIGAVTSVGACTSACTGNTPPNYNDPINANTAYDCLNGGCIPKTTHNTPGKYASLAACQSGCAKDSNCTGECVSVEELAALQQAANNLQTKFCK